MWKENIKGQKARTGRSVSELLITLIAIVTYGPFTTLPCFPGLTTPSTADIICGTDMPPERTISAWKVSYQSDLFVTSDNISFSNENEGRTLLNHIPMASRTDRSGMITSARLMRKMSPR
jgi:hypothetical protein